MKRKIPVIVFAILASQILFIKSTYSQLIVDAGSDTTYCVSIHTDTLLLGENVKIDNGVKPYDIVWECQAPKGIDGYYTASDFLDDTTSITPTIKYDYENSSWIKFIIHITDGENSTAKDSLRVRFSKFAYLTGYQVFNLGKGDSVLFQFSTVDGGIAPLTFEWNPKIGVLNPDSLVTWVKTDSLSQQRTEYSAIATDSCGCTSSPNIAYEIRLLPTGIDDKSAPENNNLNMKFLNGKLYFNNSKNEIALLSLYSIHGILIKTANTTQNYFNLTELNKNSIYIARITVGNFSNNIKIFR